MFACSVSNWNCILSTEWWWSGTFWELQRCCLTLLTEKNQLFLSSENWEQINFFGTEVLESVLAGRVSQGQKTYLFVCTQLLIFVS